MQMSNNKKLTKEIFSFENSSIDGEKNHINILENLDKENNIVIHKDERQDNQNMENIDYNDFDFEDVIDETSNNFEDDKKDGGEKNMNSNTFLINENIRINKNIIFKSEDDNHKDINISISKNVVNEDFEFTNIEEETLSNHLEKNNQLNEINGNNYITSYENNENLIEKTTQKDNQIQIENNEISSLKDSNYIKDMINLKCDTALEEIKINKNDDFDEMEIEIIKENNEDNHTNNKDNSNKNNNTNFQYKEFQLPLSQIPNDSHYLIKDAEIKEDNKNENKIEKEESNNQEIFEFVEEDEQNAIIKNKLDSNIGMDENKSEFLKFNEIDNPYYQTENNIFSKENTLHYLENINNPINQEGDMIENSKENENKITKFQLDSNNKIDINSINENIEKEDEFDFEDIQEERKVIVEINSNFVLLDDKKENIILEDAVKINNNNNNDINNNQNIANEEIFENIHKKEVDMEEFIFKEENQEKINSDDKIQEIKDKLIDNNNKSILLNEKVNILVKENEIVQNDDEFDFIEENIEEQKEQKEQKEETFKEKENDIKNNEYNINNENLQEEITNTKDEFDVKKIMDYSFSSSEEEENNNPNILTKTNNNIIDKQKNENLKLNNNEITNNFDKVKTNEKTEVNNNKTDNCDLDGLEFEDCSENDEKQTTNNEPNSIDKTEKDNNNNNNEEDEMFDFIEENDNHKNILNDGNNKDSLKAKDKEIENNDHIKNEEIDEFDFVEESEDNNKDNNNIVSKNSNKVNSENTINNNNNPYNIEFLNKDHINNLLNNYKQKFINCNPDYTFFHESLIKEKSDMYKNNIFAVENNDDYRKENNFITTGSSKSQIFPASEKIENDVIGSTNNIESIIDDEFLDVENEDNLENNKIQNKDICEMNYNKSSTGSCDTDLNKRLKDKIEKYSNLENLRFEINESKYEEFDLSEQTMGINLKNKDIKDIYKPISLKNPISNLRYFNNEPEINIKSYMIEELSKLSKNYNPKLNIKNTIFNQNIMEFSNETIRKLYFKFSDLKMINNRSSSNNSIIHNQNVNSNINNNHSILSRENNYIENSQNSKMNITQKNENNTQDDNKQLKDKFENNNIYSNNKNSNLNVTENNKDNFNETININNISNNEIITNKEQYLDNVKGLKLLNEKNTDLFNKNQTSSKSLNNVASVPNKNQNNKKNFLSSLNEKESSLSLNKTPSKELSAKEETNNINSHLKKENSGGIDLESSKFKKQIKQQQKDINSDSFDEIKEDDDLSDEDIKAMEKPKFQVNEIMSSLFSNNNANDKLNNNNNNNIYSKISHSKMMTSKKLSD